jgi:CRP-like cAMP-binding protein
LRSYGEEDSVLASGQAASDPWSRLVDPARVRVRSLQAGEALFRQGDAVAALHRVRKGRVRLVRCLEDGTAVVVHVARSGETFAEASAFADAYHCDAVAEVPTEVDFIARADVLAALAAGGEAATGFTRLLAAQVRDLRARAELRSIRSARERLLAWLRMQASGSPPVVHMARTWTEVAAELGLTREATYRALARLESEHRICRSGQMVQLQAF